MKAGECDELPTKAQLGQIPDEALHLGICHSGGVPIERWAQVVCQHLVRHRSAYLLRKSRGLAEDRLPGLHPNRICVRGESDRPLNAKVGGALDAIVALNRAGSIPVEENLAGAKISCRLPHLG